MEFYNEKIKPWLGIIALLAIGIFMIISPDAMTDADPGGRKALIKTILAYVWSIPAGVIAVLIAGFLGYGQLKGDTEEA